MLDTKSTNVIQAHAVHWTGFEPGDRLSAGMDARCRLPFPLSVGGKGPGDGGPFARPLSVMSRLQLQTEARGNSTHHSGIGWSFNAGIRVKCFRLRVTRVRS